MSIYMKIIYTDVINKGRVHRTAEYNGFLTCSFCLSVFFYERSLCIQKVSSGPLVGGNHHMDEGFSWRMETER